MHNLIFLASVLPPIYLSPKNFPTPNQYGPLAAQNDEFLQEMEDFDLSPDFYEYQHNEEPDSAPKKAAADITEVITTEQPPLTMNTSSTILPQPKNQPTHL